jgi:hypothetical protein
MPGVIPSESNGLSRGSPSKKNRLSLKFFQKKETKRALDFTDSQENEEKTSEYRGSEMYVFYFKCISFSFFFFFLFFFLKIYLFYVYEYTVAVFRHTRRGHQIPLKVVVSHHVVARI